MTKIIEAIVPQLGSWLLGIAAVIAAFAQLTKARRATSKAEPAAARTSAQNANEDSAAPAAVSRQTVRSPWRKFSTWLALFDALTIVLGFALLFLAKGSKAPVTEGALALYSLIVILCIGAVARSGR
ncbi:MAG: hypothetical protein KF715_08525 [Candidatus Didemnitutus sp.]|nr:hypothetical protein [Candidatus Didemnitutus sp.]